MTNEKLWEAVRKKYRTDVAFGMAIGWIPQRVSKLRHGKYIPTISEARVIGDAIGVSIDTLAKFF